MTVTVKWKGIADDLRARIEAGEYRPGEKVPSEADLMALHQVSRITAAKALKSLVHDGTLEDDRPRRVARHDPLTVHVTRDADTAWPGEAPSPGADAWVGDMHRAGYPPAQRIEVARPLAGRDVAGLLRISDLDVVTARRLERRAGGRPHNLITFWFPLSVATGTPLEQPDSIGEGSLAWLEKHHGPLRHKAWIRARMPSPAEAGQLRIPPGVPVQVVRRLSWNAQRPVVTSMAVYPADRTVLLLDL